jgi:8-oxo-dGTP pyrophosphatase MutT (NUDIX family)
MVLRTAFFLSQSMNHQIRSRVFLLITRTALTDGGSLPVRQVLVLSHGDERHYAGVQTPGGTVDPGEDVLVAARREAEEETGLSWFVDATLVAEDVGKLGEETVRRFFVHLPVTEAPDEWTHEVFGAGLDQGLAFRLRWLDLASARRELHPGFRDYLDRVL